MRKIVSGIAATGETPMGVISRLTNQNRRGEKTLERRGTGWL